jgi:hypothetical protein
MTTRLKLGSQLVLGLVAWSLSGCFVQPSAGEDVGSVAEAATTEAAGFATFGGLSGSFNVLPEFSMNTTGATNWVTWLATGQVRIDCPGLGNEAGGNVQVTAFAFGARCKVESWGSSGTTLQVVARCHDAAGTPTNLPLSVSYVRRAGAPGMEGGYVWADQPTASSYTPSPTYQWNSTGGVNTIARSAVGEYVVRFPGQSFTGGTVEVTAYGTGSEYCKVEGWSPLAGQSVRVRCFTASGAAADTRFTAKFTRGAPNKTGTFAYAWASQPTAANYTPSLTYQRSDLAFQCGGAQTRGPVTIARASTGRYTVTFAGIPGGGSVGKNVKVTGYGSGSDTCKVLSWLGGPTDTTAEVQCFTASGAPVDAFYTISFSSTLVLPC